MKRLVLVVLSAFGLACQFAAADDGCKFGVCVHTHRPYENVIQDKMYDAMVDAGALFMRLDVGWRETPDGSFDYSVYDEICSKTAARGISILGILGFGNGKKTALKNREEWLRYAEYVAKYFKGRISHWEVVNEPNLMRPRSPSVKNDGTGYGKLLKAASAAIRRGNPDAVVVFGGLAGVPEAYVDRAIRAAGMDSFDVMNYHVYVAPSACEPALKKRNEILNRVMKKYGEPKPIWLTEIGSSTPASFLDTLPIVRAALKYLKLENSEAFAIRGIGRHAESQLADAFPDVKKRAMIGYADIKNLPSGAVLFLPISQEFNYAYSDDLAEFVKRGGTVVYSGGGYPFWRNTSETGNKQEVSPMGKLRVDMRPGWTYGKKIPSDIDEKTVVFAPEFKELKNVPLRPPFRAFNFSPKLLREGDKFIPMASANFEGVDFVPAAIYKFDSDFKGAVVMISTRAKSYCTLEEQAEHLSRDFLYGLGSGIEKIFVYQLRSHGRISHFEGNLGVLFKDLRPKPSFFALKNLTTLMGKAKPGLREDETSGLCVAEWTSPKGYAVSAVWSYKDTVKASLKARGKYKILDVCGNPIEGGELSKICSEKPDGGLEISAGQSPVFVVFE